MTSPASRVERDGRAERVSTCAGGVAVAVCAWEEEDEAASEAASGVVWDLLAGYSGPSSGRRLDDGRSR